MPFGRAVFYKKRDTSRESLSLSVTVHDWKKDGAQVGAVTPEKCTRARKTSEPADSSIDLLRSIDSHGMEPLTLTTGSYRSSVQYKNSPNALLASNCGSIPSQEATPTYVPSASLAPAPPPLHQTPSMDATSVTTPPHNSPFDHPRPSTAYDDAEAVLPSSTARSLRAFVGQNPRSASVASTLSPSQRGSLREEMPYDDSLCMPLPPAGTSTHRRSPCRSPSTGQVSYVLPRPSPTRTSGHPVGPSPGAAATAAAAAAAEWQARHRSPSSGVFVKENRASTNSSQGTLPNWPPERRNSNSLQSDTSGIEAYLAAAGMPSVLTPSEPPLSRYQSHHRTNSGPSVTLMNGVGSGVNPPNSNASAGSRSTDSCYPRLQPTSSSQQGSGATTSGGVTHPTILTNATAPSTPLSASTAHHEINMPCMCSGDACDRPSARGNTSPPCPTTLDISVNTQKPVQLRGGRHAFNSAAVTNGAAPPARSNAADANAAPESAQPDSLDDSASLLAPMDVSFVFGDSSFTSAEAQVAHASHEEQDMAKVANRRVQQYLSQRAESKKPAAVAPQPAATSVYKGASDLEGSPNFPAPAAVAAVLRASSSSHGANSVVPGSINNSDIERERPFHGYGGQYRTMGDLPSSSAAPIKSYPVATSDALHPAAATRADISPQSQRDVLYSSIEDTRRKSRHMHVRRSDKVSAQSGLDAEKGNTPDSSRRGADQVLHNLEATPSSMSPRRRRASRSGAQHSAQHASYAHSVTPPHSLDRKSSQTSNPSYAMVEACTMDALAAQHSGSMMSANKMPAPGSSHRRPPSGAYSMGAPRSRSSRQEPGSTPTPTYQQGLQPSSHNSALPADHFASANTTLTRGAMVGMDTSESNKSTTRSQRLNVRRPKPGDNFSSGAPIAPQMHNAAFSSAPHITMDMIAKGKMGGDRAEDSIMSDANFDSVLTTNTSIGGVLNNVVDHCESARLEKANPFRETMDSITSQHRAPRLGGNELFNSHLDSLREALAQSIQPRVAAAKQASSADRVKPAAPAAGAAAAAAAGSGAAATHLQPAAMTAPMLREPREPVRQAASAHAKQSSTGPVQKAQTSSVSRSERDYREHHGECEVRSRHPTPPHAAIRGSGSKGNDPHHKEPNAHTHMHAQPQSNAQYYNSKVESHSQARSQPTCVKPQQSQKALQQPQQQPQPSHRLDKDRTGATSMQRRTHGSHARGSRRLQWPKRNHAPRLHPSAMSRLHNSLAKGIYKDDVVLPVHIYLPPVKLKRVRGSQPAAQRPRQPSPQPAKVPQLDLDGQCSRPLSTPPTFPKGNHSPLTPTHELGDTQPIKERSVWLPDPALRSGVKSTASVRPMPCSQRGGNTAEPRSAAPEAASEPASTHGVGRSSKQAAAAPHPFRRSKLHTSQMQSAVSKRSMMTGSFAQSWLTCFAPARTLDDVSDHESCCSDIEDAGACAAADVQADIASVGGRTAAKQNNNTSRGWRNLMRSTHGSTKTKASHMQSRESAHMRTSDSTAGTDRGDADRVIAVKPINPTAVRWAQMRMSCL